MSLVNSAALHCCDFKKGSILEKKKVLFTIKLLLRGRHHPVWEIPQDTDFKDFLVNFTENNKRIGKRDIQAKHSYTDLMLYSTERSGQNGPISKAGYRIQTIESHTPVFSCSNIPPVLTISLVWFLYHSEAVKYNHHRTSVFIPQANKETPYLYRTQNRDISLLRCFNICAFFFLLREGLMELMNVLYR